MEEGKAVVVILIVLLRFLYGRDPILAICHFEFRVKSEIFNKKLKVSIAYCTCSTLILGSGMFCIQGIGKRG